MYDMIRARVQVCVFCSNLEEGLKISVMPNRTRGVILSCQLLKKTVVEMRTNNRLHSVHAGILFSEAGKRAGGEAFARQMFCVDTKQRAAGEGEGGGGRVGRK